MTDVEKAEAALAKAKREAAKKITQTQVDLNKFCIGKFAKNVHSYNFNTSINFVKIIDVIRYNDGKPMYGFDHKNLISETVNLSYSRVGYHVHKNDVKYMGPRCTGYYPLRKHYEKGVTIDVDNYRSYGYTTVERLADDKKSFYDGHKWYTFCSEQEYMEAVDIALESNELIKAKASKLKGDIKEYGELITFNEVDKKYLDEFLVKMKDGRINIKDYLHVAKASRQFIQFDSNNQLSELAQYRLTEKTGLELVIESGDDGTDYEPYTTRYVLSYVVIDWAKVLYTIRTKLDSVINTAVDLEKVMTVYNTDNWSVNYGGTYDVAFENAALYSTVLAEVNAVIKKHLK